MPANILQIRHKDTMNSPAQLRIGIQEVGQPLRFVEVADPGITGTAVLANEYAGSYSGKRPTIAQCLLPTHPVSTVRACLH
jgi:hypothetical protein